MRVVSNRSGPCPDKIVAEISADLTQGSLDCVARVFAERGLMSPMVLWSPSRHDISHPALKHFARDCGAIMDDDGRVLATDFDALDMEPHKGSLMDVMPVAGGCDFQYRHYGTQIAAVFGRDMSGRHVSDLDSFVSKFFIATYRAVVDRKQWAYTTHEPPQTVFARAWNRLLVPLYSADGQVERIVGLNVGDCDLSDGLELILDPVVVINADDQVVYANSTARTHFGTVKQGGKPAPADRYLGFALPTEQLRNAFEHHGQSSDTNTSAFLNGVVVHYRLTLRPITFRDRPYVAAVLRLD